MFGELKNVQKEREKCVVVGFELQEGPRTFG
jgi:hypothetical protein